MCTRRQEKRRLRKEELGKPKKKKGKRSDGEVTIGRSQYDLMREGAVTLPLSPQPAKG